MVVANRTDTHKQATPITDPDFDHDRLILLVLGEGEEIVLGGCRGWWHWMRRREEDGRRIWREESPGSRASVARAPQAAARQVPHSSDQ